MTLAYNNARQAISGERMKALLWADAQPANSAQVANWRDVLDDMAARHRDAEFAVAAGDLVDRASLSGSGDAPNYGFPEMIADWAARKLPRLMPIPGNHDRDGTFQGVRHEKGWTYRTYREHFGPEYYAFRVGTTVWVMLGDMAGSTFGEITPAALKWFSETLLESQGSNVFVVMHAPVEGAWNPDGGSGKQAFQRSSAALGAIIAAHDNIAAVFYGHVGFNYALSSEVRSYAGTLWIGTQMGLERATRVENGGSDDWPFHYAVLDFVRGLDEVAFWREDAKTGAMIPDSEVTIPLRYPAQFHGGVDFDGSQAAQRMQPVLRGPVTIEQDASDRRVVRDGEYHQPLGPQTVLTLDMTEVAVDDMLEGDGTAVLFKIPGSVLQYLSTADGTTPVTPTPNEGDTELQFDTLDDFPETGDPEIWYLALDTGTYYRWIDPLGEYQTAPSGRYVAGEPGSGIGGLVAAVKAAGADNNFSAHLDLFASGSGQEIDSLVHVARCLAGGIFQAINGFDAKTLTGADDIHALRTLNGSVSWFGLYNWGSPAPANAPATTCHMLHMQRNSGSAYQVVFQSGSGGVNIWVQSYTGGAWTGFFRMLTSRGHAIDSISEAPLYVGQTAVVSGEAYIAVGTSSSADWKQIT